MMAFCLSPIPSVWQIYKNFDLPSIQKCSNNVQHACVLTHLLTHNMCMFMYYINLYVCNGSWIYTSKSRPFKCSSALATRLLLHHTAKVYTQAKNKHPPTPLPIPIAASILMAPNKIGYVEFVALVSIFMNIDELITWDVLLMLVTVRIGWLLRLVFVGWDASYCWALGLGDVWEM